MKRKLALVISLIAIMALWVTPALAAQGQITEVNPSGLSVANEASEDNADNNNRNEAAGNGAPVFDLLTKELDTSTKGGTPD